jgi:hypothetical protein
LTLRDNNHLETPKRQYENLSAPDPGDGANRGRCERAENIGIAIISSDGTLHSLRCSMDIGP